MNRVTRGLSVMLSGGLALLALGGAGAAAHADPVADSLTVAGAGTPGTTVTGATQFSLGGDTPVKVAVAKISGGNATVVAGPDASGPAIQFPAYVKSGTYPRAVVSLTPTSGAGLSPGSDDFTYGAVFRLNATSSGRTIDNGDNIFQRGLYEDVNSQFKLQVDHGYPSCLVRGSAGQVLASSPLKVVPNAWYAVTCSRIGSQVTTLVQPYAAGAVPLTTVASGATGALTFTATQPASVGGKITATGAVVSDATDQFNGAIAKVWVNRVAAPPPPNQPPVANATASCVALACTFDASGSSDPDGDPLTYSWDFGDGSDPGTGVTTAHLYATGADRQVTLTVSDDEGHATTTTVTASTTDPLPVEPIAPTQPVDPTDATTDQPPAAVATASCAGLSCSFDATGSSDPENEPLTYAWDFGDGSDAGTGATPTHLYASGADRPVTLTVTDDHGNSATDVVTASTTDPVVDQPPAADATASCTTLTCSFSAAGSSDPENDPLTYAWDFGDGSAAGSGVAPSHTYATGGTRTATLTVTDDHGNSATDTVTTTTTAPPVATPISYVASAATNGNRTSHTVVVPSTVKAGDALLLFFTANSTTPTYSNPTGWTLVQSKNGDGIAVRAYAKVATAADAGSTVKLTSSAYVKSDLTLAAYRNTGTSPVAASASKVDNTAGAAHTSPAVTATGTSSWLVTYWADKSTSTSAWTAPSGQSVRAKTFGTSSGHVAALIADSNGPVAAGATGAKTATANSASTRGASVSILLAGPA